MIEPPHGVTRSTAYPRTSPYADPLPARPATAPAGQPAGPDFGDQRYAALAAWSASAETITMAAVVAGPADAYPPRVGNDRKAGAPRRAVPRTHAATGVLRGHRLWIVVLVAGLVALAAALIAIRGRDEAPAPATTGTRAAATVSGHPSGCRRAGEPCL
ncbi:hypothetical protein [Actinoplanes subglobosus]|uniref:Uncharacterized protein n=1 Tax=Actinoplanes subglobosus TaxID=1547892 RepID=A0ABV8IKV1_9ACTN